MEDTLPESVPEGPPLPGNDFTTGRIPLRLVKFAIPILLGNLLFLAYTFVNTLWVGNGLGPDSVAAVTVSLPVFFVLMALVGGLSQASNILVSQSFGAKDWGRLSKVVHNSLTLGAILGAICMGSAWYATEAILTAIKTPPEVLPLAISYLHTFLWMVPCTFGVFPLTAIMRGTGDSKTPMYFLGASLVINAVLDPFLMFGWCGLPRLELNGTAWASVIAQIFALVGIITFLHRKRHIAAPHWRRLALDPATTLLTLRIGIPSMVQQGLVSLSTIFIMRLVNRFGADSVAACGIAMRIDQLSFMPSMAICTAVSSIAGQNIGAGLFDRVRALFGWALLASSCITLCASLLALSIPAHLIGLFTDNPEVIAIGARYLRIAAPGYMFFSVLIVSNGVINGSGHTAATAMFTLVACWAIRVPLGTYLSYRLDRIEGIWYAVVISFAIGMTLSLTYNLSGRWKRPVIKRHPLPTDN